MTKTYSSYSLHVYLDSAKNPYTRVKMFYKYFYQDILPGH